MACCRSWYGFAADGAANPFGASATDELRLIGLDQSTAPSETRYCRPLPSAAQRVHLQCVLQSWGAPAWRLAECRLLTVQPCFWLACTRRHWPGAAPQPTPAAIMAPQGQAQAPRAASRAVESQPAPASAAVTITRGGAAAAVPGASSAKVIALERMVRNQAAQIQVGLAAGHAWCGSHWLHHAPDLFLLRVPAVRPSNSMCWPDHRHCRCASLGPGGTTLSQRSGPAGSGQR